MANLAPGTVVDNRFRIVEEIGRGGMGVVYRAEQPGMDREVALKIVSGADVDSVAIKRFQREAHVVASLDHPNIVRMFAFGVLNSGEPYMAMEFLPGEQLDQRIASKGKLLWEEAVHLFIPACSALAYAHEKNVIHRDIKPSNIRLCRDTASGEAEEKVKIVDFGIAYLTAGGAPKLTKTDTVLGTIVYASPEQLTGKPITVASDIYSLGCTLFEALTERTPFVSDSPFEIMQAHLQRMPPSLAAAGAIGVPDSMEQLVQAMMAKDPADRPSSMKQVEDALKAISAGQPIEIATKKRKFAYGALNKRWLIPAIAFSAAIMWYWNLSHPAQHKQSKSSEALARAQYDDWKQRGESYLDDKKYREARRLLEQPPLFLPTNQERVEIFCDLAEANFFTGEEDKANRYVEQSLAIARKNGISVGHPFILRTHFVLVSGDFDSAAKLFEKHLLPNPSFAELKPRDQERAYRDAMLIYTALGDTKRAQIYTEDLLERHADLPPTAAVDDMKLHALSVRSPKAAFPKLEKAIRERAAKLPGKFGDDKDAQSALGTRRRLKVLLNDLERICPASQKSQVHKQIVDNVNEIEQIRQFLR